MLDKWIWNTNTNKGNNCMVIWYVWVQQNSQDVNKVWYGRPCSSTNKGSVAEVLQVFTQSVKKCVRQCSCEICVHKNQHSYLSWHEKRIKKAPYSESRRWRSSYGKFVVHFCTSVMENNLFLISLFDLMQPLLKLTFSHRSSYI